MNKMLQIALSISLGASLLLGIGHPPQAAAGNNSTNASASEPSSVQLEKSYTEMLQEWSKLPAASAAKIVVNPSENPANRDLVTAKADSFGYASDTVHLTGGSEAIVQVDVPETGLYQLSFDYLSQNDEILPAEGYVQINRSYPFYESRRILFPDQWQDPQSEPKLDRYGNELLPRPVKTKTWQHAYAMDASYYYMKPLLYKLEKGANTITIAGTRGDVLLGSVTIDTPVEIQSYADYRKQQPSGSGPASLHQPIVVEAEHPAAKNDSSIRAASEEDPSVTPFDTGHKLLNDLAGFSWEEGGQSVTWEMDAPQDGLYKIALKYKQSVLHEMPVFRRVEIDGQVPFRETENVSFPYSKKWTNLTLGTAEGEPYEFYLTKGKHTLTMSVSLEPVRPLAEMIVAQMKEISSLTLEIKKLTGNKTDLYRDWSLHEYIPDLDKTLNRWADQLQAQYDELNRLNPHTKEISELVNLKMAYTQLRSLAKAPDKLPNRMTLFSEGSSSVSEKLGDLLQRITLAPMDVDKIYVYQQGKLPKPTAGFFSKLGVSVKRFFLSFKHQSYAATAADGSELNVWVNRPRPYVELLQKMIDEQFTPSTGITVNLSLMPDQNKLILANASGSAPDVALGVDNWIPYDLAVRNAAVDLRKFSDFQEVIRPFSKGAIIPFTFEDGVYAVPETQDFWVLFYRKDILDNLKLGVPSTWDDVVKMLPELQRLGMNFYEPLALSGGFKPFNATTPFIYQFGGELFSKDGMTTAIDSEAALNGFKFMTDLFTIYNLPQSVPNFYNHFRYGMLPIGISNFTTYVQLKAAAPEIANEWKIAPHPGVERDGVVQRWASSGGQTGMILKGTKHEQQAWDFLKWWISKDTQVEYANQLQTQFGPTFMWNTANLDAFAQIPWPEEDKKVILEQYKWAREASRVPGYYMVERELSSAWNAVVFNGANPRTAIDDGVIRSNREIAKKMEEFGYVQAGKPVKPYPVPTIDTIDKWVETR